MKIEIEIPDSAEFDAIADEDMRRIIEAAVCTGHWYEHTGTELDLSAARAKVIDSAWTKKPTKSFLAWLKAQTKRDDIVGDLARDAAKDPRTPHGRATKQQWRDYLGGAQHIVTALEEAWAEFLRSEPSPRAHDWQIQGKEMKKKIYSRKVGSKEDMALLIEGEGVSTGGRKVDQGQLDEFALANTRRAVLAMRERGIEGYVIFENDPTRYEFTPDADFVYPAAVH
jgi:hypothetical protein